MQIQSTADVPLLPLEKLVSELPPEWAGEVDDEQVFMKAIEVPSWVSILSDAPWWLKFLGGSVAVYVGGFISEAGKDTWKHRGQIADALRSLPSPITRFAQFVEAAQSVAQPKTFVVLAVPLPPNGFQKVCLRLEYETRGELEFAIALFVHHLPAVMALVEREQLAGGNVVGDVFLDFSTADCSMLASWLNRASLRRCEELLPIR